MTGTSAYFQPTTFELQTRAEAMKLRWRSLLWIMVFWCTPGYGRNVAEAPADDPSVIKLEPFTITATKPEPESNGLKEIFEEINRALIGSFAALRNGFLIEDILWRHKYLAEHPNDKAEIITVMLKQRLMAATTAYSEHGQVFISSYALGEHVEIPQFLPKDLTSEEQLNKLSRLIIERRRILRDAIFAAGPPPLGTLMVKAEESGDYGGLRAGATPFYESTQGVLNRSFQALHDPDQAGLVPAALGSVPVNTPDGKTQSHLALLFDWDGRHYAYFPNWGTYGMRIPKNPVTQLPFLFVKNGEFLESVLFYTAYKKLHSSEGVAFIPGAHPAVAYTREGRLCLFSAHLGFYTCPPKFSPALIANAGLLRKLHETLASYQPSIGKTSFTPHPIPDHLPGDNADMQIRRTLLTFQKAGIATRFNGDESSGLTFDWQGETYVYDGNQEVSGPIAKPVTTNGNAHLAAQY